MTERPARQFAMIALTIVGMVAFWQAAVAVLNIHPILLPAPTRVFRAFLAEWQALCWAFLYTASTALAGLTVSIIVGSMVAILFSQSPWMRRSLYPYVVFLQTVPIIAIAPLLITWFGHAWRTTVLIAVIISLFPIISNVTTGLISVDKNLRDLFRLSHATRLQTLWKLQIPAAVGHLVLGVRVSAGMSVIGAIVGEFFVGSYGKWVGLGTIMTGWQTNNRTDAVIAATIISTLLGLIILGLVNLASNTILSRWTRDVGFESGE